MPVEYLGYAGVAKLFGVEPGTVSKWITRCARSSFSCPEPSATIDGRPGWSDPAAWYAWKLSVPGQGTGGGPLPLERATTEFHAALEFARAEKPDAAGHHEQYALYRIADTYGVDRDGLIRLVTNIGDKNPDMPPADHTIRAVATVIRRSRAMNPQDQ